MGTEADKVRGFYKAVGEAQNHTFGTGVPGSKPPDFNMKLPGANGAPAIAQPANPQQTPPAPGKAPDAARRANQAAGAPPGGIPKE